MPAVSVAPPPDQRAWLELPDGVRHPLDGICTIGRVPPKTLVFPDSHVSSTHAVLQPAPDGAWTLTDLRSTNGTFLEGRKLSAPALLTDEARFRIGPFQLVFRQPSRPSTGATRAALSGTAVQIYHGPAWLMLLDLENFTARRQALGPARTDTLQRAWVAEVRALVEINGGTLNSQPGDALLIYWQAAKPGDAGPSVDTTLRALVALQSRAGELPFRLVLHHGPVHIATGELRSEQLGGPEVDFLFRIEKLAKPLRARCLLSAAAALALDLTLETRDLGAHSVPSFVGRFRLHAFGPAASLAVDADAATAPTAPAPPARTLVLAANPGALADGLAQLLALETDFSLVGRAASAREARKLHAAKKPDLLILDHALADGDPMGLIRDLRAALPEVRILALVSPADTSLVERTLRAGALGAVLANDSTDELLLAVRTTLAGGVYLSRRLAATTLRALAGSDEGGRRGGPASLSDRELEIFHLVAVGRANRDIAEALGVSVKTVETHKENIKVKLGLASAAALAETARRWLETSRSRPPF